jgi:hypothetical protein
LTPAPAQVALLPGFAKWISDSLMPADFVNLQVVRAWGAKVGGSPALLRVSGAMRWPAWDGMALPFKLRGGLRSPNLLVSGYIARRERLPVLLTSFAQTEEWRQQCTIDQLLARIQYALASASLYDSLVVDASHSLLAHCAVGPEEVAMWKSSHPVRHARCASKRSDPCYRRRDPTADAQPDGRPVRQVRFGAPADLWQRLTLSH